MSVVGFIRRALAMGIDHEMALRMGEAFEAEMPVFVPAQKSKAALRTEKWRAAKASQTVTGPSPTVTANAVTNRHQPSRGDGCDASPPAHVRDNLSRLEITGFAEAVAEDARDPGSDWPPGNATDHAQLLVALAASGRLDPAKQLGLTTTAGRLDSWKRQGASWTYDVVPAVVVMSQKRGPPIGTWKYFDPAIGQSIADNRRALQIPAAGNDHDRPAHRSEKLAAKQANLESAQRGFEIASARRPF